MGRAIEYLVGNFRLGEGPRWRAGYLYFVDGFSNKIHRLAPDHELETYCEMEHPSGMGWLPDGDMVVVSSQACELYRLHDAKPRKFADLGGYGLSSCNDLVTDRRGHSYLGGIGPTAGTAGPCPILHVTPSGEVSVAANDLYCPNGLVVTPDGKTLIVAETTAFRLTAFDVGEDGTLTNRRVWAQLGPSPVTSFQEATDLDGVPLPDGLTLDQEGAVWMGDCRSGAGVARVAEGGKIIERIQVGQTDTVLAPALGGPAGKDLYLVVGPGLDLIPEVLAGTEKMYSVQRTRVDVAGAGSP